MQVEADSKDAAALENQNNSSGDQFIASSGPSGGQRAAYAIRSFLGNLKYQVFITCLTIYSLFSDDFRTAFFSQEADFGFDAVSLGVMVVFGVEIVLSALVVDGYFLSFFFFLDVVSTASIIFDVNFITDSVFSTSNSSSVAQLASQSKASRAATRAVRIVKLFRIIRIIKLYKNAEKAKEIKQQTKQKQLLKEKMSRRRNRNRPNESPSNPNLHQQSQNLMLDGRRTEAQQIFPEEQLPDEGGEVAAVGEFNEEQVERAMKKESRIGKILSQLSIRKIIVVVLLMMFIIPLFNIDVFRDPENAWDYTLYHHQQLLLQSPSDVPTPTLTGLVQNSINSFLGEDNYIIQYISPFNELPYLNQVDLSSLRNQDLISSTQSVDLSAVLALRSDLSLRAGADPSLSAILNQVQYNKKSAYFSMAKTLFVCLVLLLLMQMFAKDIDTLLVEPIEGMMEKLMLMARDPESAAKEELNTNTQLETTVISNAIIKIGALLSIVFGSAGAQIIGANIVEEGDMNPMIEGKKKCAIFGFCDIRHFTEVTEVLQEEILIFVNKIGSLVHESVYRYGGSANKNIGEAFLLVWKIPEEKYLLNQQTNAIEWRDRRYLSVLADFSLLGFVKTLVKIHKDPLVLEYGLDARLQQKLGEFRVEMGFGLHVGWAIEGAIGSEYKIDASYLSPNVNMASRLEAATKQFGVDFLISEDLYELLTPDMKDFCRNIDRVTVKGSEKPIRLYTVDLAYERISPPARKDLKYPDPSDVPDSESKRALNLDYLKDEEIPNYNAKKFIAAKKELREVMLHSLPEDFRKRFELGVSCYLKGKWGDSRLHLSEALKFRNSDGPTKTLLAYMKKSNFTAPSTWKQFRPLTSK